MTPTSPRLIVGLGNPGREFENTYHNVGFFAVDFLLHATRPDEAPAWKTHQKKFSYVRAGEFIFMKPLTFMNESGVAVKEAMKKFCVTIAGLSVVHDESDLAIGSFKISTGKNSAGHNGAQSIIDHVGTNEFQRIRIGIRPVAETIREKASAFVLSHMTKKDQEAFEEVFKEVGKGLG